MTAPDYPDPSLFDSRTARKAVRRGVFRTAGLVVVVLVTLSIAGAVFGRVLTAVSGHEGAFERVGAVGVHVGHPDLLLGSSSSQNSVPERSWLGGERKRVEISNGTTGKDYTYTLRSRADGNVDEVDLSTPLDRQIFRGRRSGKVSAAAFVKGLPTSTLTTAVVGLATPMTPQELDEHFGDKLQHRLESGAALFYDDPFRTPEEVEKDRREGQFASRPVTWPVRADLDRYDSFASWAAALRGSDDGSLDALGLPSSAEIKRLADDGRVYAIYSPGLTVEDMKALLADSAVATILPVDVRFDFDAIQVDG